MTNKSKKHIKRDYSKGVVKGYSWNNTEGTVHPDFSFQAVLQLIDNDTVARGALNHFVDKCMEGEYSIIRRDTFKYDREAELRLEEQFMFRTKLLRKIYLLGKLFNNVFIEIVRTTDGSTKALNILDSTTIEAITLANGDLVSIKSKIPNPDTGKYQVWDKKDIVWIKFGDRTEGWAPVDMRALWENLLAKSYVSRYVAWLWKTGQYRLMYNFKNSSNQDIQDFLAYARKNDSTYNIPFVAKGDMDVKVMRDIRETSNIIEMLKYYDSQTLILLRVPPIDAGIPDASGRSNADAQANNIETTVMSWKKLVQDYINFELFPKISKSKVLLRFGPVNRFAVKQVLGMTESLQKLGFSEEVMREFLSDNGIFFSEEKLMAEVKTDSITGAVNAATAKDPRVKKDAGESNKVLDEVSTREDQIKKV
jgi:hypothetical protein